MINTNFSFKNHYLFALVFLFVAPCKNVVDPNPNPPVVVNSEIGGLYGINIQNLFDQCKGMPDDEIMTHLVELSPNVMRFPGGSSSNRYRYDKVSKSLKDDVKGWVIPLENAVDVFRITGSKMLLVVNVLSGTVQEGLDLVRDLKAEGIVIQGIELGNELYLPFWKVTISEYKDMAKPMALALKNAFPNIPISAVIAPKGVQKSNARSMLVEKKEFADWNRQLNVNPFFDAVSIHTYLGIKDCVGRVNDNLSQRVDCVQPEVRVFVDEVFPSLMRDIANKFPGKSIWLTEWNVHDGKKVTNTLVHGMLVREIFLKCLELNIAEGIPIDQNSFFAFGKCSVADKRVKGYYSLGFRSPGETGDRGSENYVRTTAYEAITPLKSLFSRPRNRIQSLNSDTQIEFTDGTSARDVFLSVFSNPDTLFVYYDNHGTEDKGVKSIKILGKEYPGELEWWNPFLQGNSLSASLGFTTEEENTSNPLRFKNRKDKTEGMIFRSHSMGVFKISLRIPPEKP